MTDANDAPPLLITGAAGRLGRHLLAAAGGNAIGVVRERTPGSSPEMEAVELSDEEATQRLLRRCRPGVVIHAAAWTDVDGCEHDRDRRERDHLIATRNVARAARSVGAGLVFVSTDFVFAGTDEPYGERDVRAPQNAYGRAKRDAEDAACAEHDRAWVVRGTFVAPEQVVALIETLSSGGVVQADVSRSSTPLTVAAFAENILSIACSPKLANAPTGTGGIRHLPGPESLTRFEFTRRIVEALGEDPARVVPAGEPPARAARRPKDVSLWTRYAYSAPALDTLFPALIASARAQILAGGKPGARSTSDPA